MLPKTPSMEPSRAPCASAKTDETLSSKLGVVERYLESEVEVGSVTESATWFSGELPLRAGFCGPGPSGMLYFSGIEDGVLLALMGSAHHQIGQQADPSEILVRYSEMPALFSVLARQEPGAPGGTRPALPTRPDDDESVIGEVFEFADALTGVRQPSEFLARRLLYGSIKDASGSVDRVLLGTPVFVALTET
jgi:hypothetical protein